MRYSIVFALLLTLTRPALAYCPDLQSCEANVRNAEGDFNAASDHYFYEREKSLGMVPPGPLVDPESALLHPHSPEKQRQERAADAAWMARCVLRIDTDDLGVRRYVYKPGAVNCP